MKLVFAFFILGSLMSFGQVMTGKNELLWEISGNGLKSSSYLFGSFHSNDKRIFEFGDSTYASINSCQAIVLETDISSIFSELDTRNGEVRFLYDENGNPYTSNKEAGYTLYGNEDGMPQFLDAHLQQFAYLNQKNFYFLETVDDQLGALNNSSDYMPGYAEIQSRIISQEKILKLYLEGDIYGLDKLMRTSLSMYKDLYQKLIIDRNIIMTTGIDTLIRKEKVFIAVGAGHLAGDEGIINLLRKKGYHVRLIPHNPSNPSSFHRKEFYKNRAFVYKDESNGLSAEFSGKPIVYDDERMENHGSYKLVYRELGQGNTFYIELIPKEEYTLKEIAFDYIQCPRTAKIKFSTTVTEVKIAEGLSDTYPEGLAWVRVIEGADFYAIAKSYGGNKFMNSKRAQRFFNSIWLD